jgi:hypothetical protein
MDAYKGTARTIGILFIVASVTAVVGGSLVALPLEESNYLVGLADKDVQVITGVLLLMVQAIAVIGIAVMFFPVLKRRNEGMALGFVAARTVEGLLVVAGAVCALAVLSLSRDYGQTGDVGVEALGDTLVAAYQWIYLLGPMLFFSVSALILYAVLYRANLVPTWLSIWGLIGGALLLVRTVLEMYGVEVPGAIQGLLTAPIGLNEMVLAVWLIVKGFNAAPHFTPQHEGALPTK